MYFVRIWCLKRANVLLWFWRQPTLAMAHASKSASDQRSGFFWNIYDKIREGRQLKHFERHVVVVEKITYTLQIVKEGFGSSYFVKAILKACIHAIITATKNSNFFFCFTDTNIILRIKYFFKLRFFVEHGVRVSITQLLRALSTFLQKPSDWESTFTCYLGSRLSSVFTMQLPKLLLLAY